MGRVVVAGLGPGSSLMIPARVWELIGSVSKVIFRTETHPSFSTARAEIEIRNPNVEFSSFDLLYERAGTFDSLYEEMARRLIDMAGSTSGIILYLVPGSPLVAEKSVEILRESGPDFVEIVPGTSFLELAWSALGIDPFSDGVTMIDATEFPALAKVHGGPFLLCQAWSKQILSEIKLAVPDPGDSRAVILQRLGSDDESIVDMAWDDIDRLVEPDHLTTVYVSQIPAQPGPALVELFDIIARLRKECPWDREQTHQSLVKHLIEESYEVVDAIAGLEGAGEVDEPELYEDLKGELGDLLVQVYFHANLADEEGRFNLSDVADTVVKKLIRRHPHVFTDLEVSDSAQVVSNWEKIKQTQEGRESVLEGIPLSLPTLLLVSKLLRKATAVGIGIPPVEKSLGEVSRSWRDLSASVESGTDELSFKFGELMWWIANLAKEIGIDVESALRSKAKQFMEEIRAAEEQ